MSRSGSQKKRSTQDPKWRLVERIVAVLEKSLTPEAEVRHDQKLPVLTTTGKRQRRRQFDVVIKTGKPPRETLTVVEVQDRSRVVGEEQLVAWHRKMQQVGAQHLICVSTKGFTASARDYARGAGPTVRLARLKELQEGLGPLQTALGGFRMIERITGPLHIEIGLVLDALVRAALSDGKTEAVLNIQMRLNRKLAALYQPGWLTPVSLDGLIENRRATILKNQNHEEGVHKVKLVSAADGVFDYVDGNTTHRLILDISDTIEIKKYVVPLTCLSYEQEHVTGEVAWIMKASFQIQAKDADFRLSFVADAEGNLVLKPHFFGLPPGAAFNGIFEVQSQTGELKFHHELLAVAE